MASTYRGAVVGYGNLGARHAEVMSGLEPIRLVAVADEVAEARARAEQDWPGVARYDDAAEMLRKEDLDIVAVATHASSHAALSRLAADCGAHVVCEKPMAASLAEADTMVARFEAAGLQLVIDHQFRLGPGATTTAALLEEGAIGRLQTIRANFTKSRPAGWELGVTGTHVFDMVCKVAGNPTDCIAHILADGNDASRDDITRGGYWTPSGMVDHGDPSHVGDHGWVVGDSLGAVFRFDSGAVMLAEGYVSDTYPYGGPRIEIAGERRQAERRKRGDRVLIELRGPKGRLRVSGNAFDEVYVARGAYPEDEKHNIPWQPVALPARPERPTMSYMAATIAPVYEQLIRTIEHGEPHPCNGVGGRRVMEMISAIFASHFAGAPVTLPLVDRNDPLAPR